MLRIERMPRWRSFLGGSGGRPRTPPSCAVAASAQVDMHQTSFSGALGRFVVGSSSAVNVGACWWKRLQVGAVCPQPSMYAGGKGDAGTAPKRARHAYRAGGSSTGGAATSEGASDGAGKEKEKSKDDDKALSLVEKRLKQNREAARRSRERKRHLKEELRRRMPVLQKQHDEMAAEVDELMKSMWVWHLFLLPLLFD